MRCTCCDHILTDFEATRKFKSTGDYADMCNACVKELPPDIEFITRGDLGGDTSVSEFDIDEDNLDDSSD